jgi:vacuolar-type H+-ATPase subunit H
LLATGKLPRIASAALAFTVVPGSLGAHLFWNEDDPERKAQKRRDLLTDLSLLGGLIIASADTAGKPSLGWRGRQAAGRISEAVSHALPLDGSDGSVLDSEFAERIAHGLQVGAERGRELASTAGEKSAPYVDAARKRARKRGAQLADTVRERGTELAETARERGTELAETARERGTELAETARERGTELAARGRVKARRWR